MKKINYEKLRNDAKNTEVSVYILIKREVNYRKKTSKDYRPGNCSLCTKLVNPVYTGITKMQCLDIGVINDRNADIKPDHICDRFIKLSGGF